MCSEGIREELHVSELYSCICIACMSFYTCTVWLKSTRLEQETSVNLFRAALEKGSFVFCEILNLELCSLPLPRDTSFATGGAN